MHICIYITEMDWNDLRYFIALSRMNTLKEAGKRLGIDQATVGRRIHALEETLGTKLFEKKSNGFFLTAAGERIRGSVEEMEGAAQSIERQIAGQDTRLEGSIKIALPGALANHLVIPLLEGFAQKYPKIQIHFLTGPETVNLAKREADIAFRLVRPTHAGLIVKRIGDVSLSLFGHRSLLNRTAPIKGFADLREFPFVALNEHAMSATESLLRERVDPYINPLYFSAAWSSVYYSLSAQAGIGILPHFLAAQNSELKRIEVAGSGKSTLWSVVHPEMHKSARLTAVLNYLVPAVKERLVEHG